MKKILATIFLLLAYSLVAAFTSATDSFSYTTGDISSSGNWTCSETNGIGADGSESYNNAAVNTGQICYWSHDSFSADQSSVAHAVGISVGVFNTLGVGARITGTSFSNFTGYYNLFDYFNGTWTIYKLASSTFTPLSSGSTTVSDGDIFELDVSGTTLTAKQNGSTLGSTTDSTYPTGSPGIAYATYGGAATVKLGSWTGDPIAGGGSTINGAIILNPKIGGRQ
jgi:hypothetical protein